MTLLVQPRLVNEPFSDAGLLLDFRFGSRAVLFDIGDLSPLSPREILRLSHVFVSHMHMDHFAGFDRLLRLFLYRNSTVHFFGPPGLTAAVEAKLNAYTWNLLDDHSHDFTIIASDWAPAGFLHSRLFRAQSGFAPKDLPPIPAEGNILLDDPDFRIEAAMLEHGVPCLAFAFQEKIRVNVQKRQLEALGLPVGPWLSEAKRAIRRGADPETTLAPTADQRISVGELLAAEALRTGPGQRIVYATDLAFNEANLERVVALARGAGQLFIEAGFLHEDRRLADAKRHLTAAEAGTIARLADVGHAVPMHFSPRYIGRENELHAEFRANLIAGSAPDHSP
ncbi:ribonuclease Z [Mesorhizobium sp.]|uniref:ribonuclease Z n=1 Tax=Mesorhizobium sp. TaxID=1871066 RepID=UPI00121A3B61|nr:ribonuclease Z [Mesorhizobium sp.]TIS55071.1 MAG: ribonuclease Z [Mesorhizobium sp.]TIS92937.1 MAG: ribonuclease Z [Mesorhizobium sp.]